MEGIAFLESFRQSQEEWGDERSRVCLHCHAPLAMENDDWDLAEKVTWEGVNCDVCHSMADVDLSGHGPRMVLDIGSVKRGPVEDAHSTGHEVAYSPLHRESLVCASCHEYANADGTPVMTTFTEWQNSEAADAGITCQDCHMSTMTPGVVDPRIDREQEAKVNIHRMPGGHSRSQLAKALDIDYQLERTPAGLSASVTIVNDAGHAVPTGMPSREIVLTVRVATPGQEERVHRRVFSKTFTGESGEAVRYTWGFFERGVRISSDTRLAADETWTETFDFPIPQETTAYFRIRLDYRNAMAEAEHEGTQFRFFSERRTVRYSNEL